MAYGLWPTGCSALCVAVLSKGWATAYMDVGEGREQGAEALPAKCALQLNASGLAETLLYYSEVP